MIKSRLRMRSPLKTITVKAKTFSGVQHSETDLYTDLLARHEQAEAEETAADGGVVIVVADVIWFEAEPGASLPQIEEGHILVDGAGQSYEVKMVQDQAGGGNRLKVVTRRIR